SGAATAFRPQAVRALAFQRRGEVSGNSVSSSVPANSLAWMLTTLAGLGITPEHPLGQKATVLLVSYQRSLAAWTAVHVSVGWLGSQRSLFSAASGIPQGSKPSRYHSSAQTAVGQARMGLTAMHLRRLRRCEGCFTGPRAHWSRGSPPALPPAPCV